MLSDSVNFFANPKSFRLNYVGFGFNFRFGIIYRPPLATQKQTTRHQIAIYLHLYKLNTEMDQNFLSNSEFSI